ncbi:hypothetical protein Q3W71_29810 [Micromonospora sp. C28SCA-DRY-2]|uniref:hypothetical protein n=1 Tax=Micromonospora sp. C28SCA-DRY-2 TaxID=3059522 RepID=UPI002674BE94|nr:hypothetical protein [Micromonospora sp. C28SCA-DRY-2]MDO3705874.1 hypothetical protein [Micromonospora sp. C28SCA-DRY-2]
MTVRVVPDRRRGAVLHVVGSSGDSRPVPRAGRVSPTRQPRGPVGPPRRDDDRRWETDVRGWRDG